MDKSKSIERLNDLIKLNFDAVNAYQEAIEEISLEDVRTQLRQYQNDHRSHIQKLSGAVRGLGGTPEEKPSAKGFFLKGITSITAKMGNEAALRAMQSNETLVNNTYARACKEDWSPDLKAIVEANYRIEQQHLSYIQQCITRRVWEQPAAHP